ncbi:MAG: ABC transporter ATP-binding protein [Ilumatobacteraceae bacterium]
MSSVDHTISQGAIATIGAGVQVAPSLRRGIGLTVFLARVGAAGRVVVPILLQQAIDRGFSRVEGRAVVDVEVVSLLCVIGFFSLLVAGVAQRTAVLRLGRSSEEALYGLRTRLFQHIHRISVEDHNDEKRGALVARVTSDVETLSQFYSWGGLAFLLNGALMVIVSGVMLAYDWMLALVVIGVSAPLFIVLRRVQSYLVAAYDRVRETNGAMLGAASEVINGAETLIAYRVGDEYVKRTVEVAEERARAQTRASLIGAFLFPSGEVFGTIAVSTVIALGVWRGPGSSLSAGAVIGFVFLTYRFLEPIAEMTEVLDQTQTAVAGLRRVLGILAIPVGPPVDPRPVAIPSGPITVDIDDVSFSYRPREGETEDPLEPVLSHVSACIRPGTRLAIVGETGSGKTTLGRVLARFVDPSSGSVRLNGIPLTRVSNEDLRRRLVVVPQEPFLFDDTIAANLRFADPELELGDLLQKVVDLDLRDWIDTLPAGLDTEVGQRGSNLSAGERQLVALIRASLVPSSVLVLDEATSSVDAVTEVRIGRILERMASGRTTIAIAHRLSTAARADRILVFDKGRLVEDGPHHELLARRGVYFRMYEDWRRNSSRKANDSAE